MPSGYLCIDIGPSLQKTLLEVGLNQLYLLYVQYYSSEVEYYFKGADVLLGEGAGNAFG